MHTRSSKVRLALVFACGAWLLVGCDYGRAGRYTLSFQPKLRHEITTAITNADERRAVELLQSALREQGFTQLRPGFWTRRGADVSWQTNALGELTLSVGSFGAKRGLREAEQAELELVRSLLLQPGIRVTPVEARRE